MIERRENSDLSEASYLYIRSAADGRLRVARIASHAAVYACSAICYQAADEADAVAALAEATDDDYLSGELADYDAALAAEVEHELSLRLAASVDHEKTRRFWLPRLAAEIPAIVKSEIRVRVAAAAGSTTAAGLPAILV